MVIRDVTCGKRVNMKNDKLIIILNTNVKYVKK